MARVLSHVKRLAQILIFIFMMALNSCVYLVVGGLGAVGGYAISPDTVEGIFSNRKPSEIWEATEDVIGVMGLIEERSEAAGMMICKIQGAKVTVTITRMSESAVKMTVKSRRAMFPRIKLSEEIFLKVHKYLNE